MSSLYNEPTPSFFDTYDFIWTPQRQKRTPAEVQLLMTDPTAGSLSGEERGVVRELLYSVIDDTGLRQLVDGFLLPPPFSVPDLCTYRWTAPRIATVVKALDPALDSTVVLMPFNMSLSIGVYDARLRAACTRLCWVLAIPFQYVEAHEMKVAASATHLRALPSMASGGGNGDPTGASPIHLNQQQQQQQLNAISENREQRRFSPRRIATVGAFTVIGASVLIVTGGLAAPLIAPAYAALVGAASATIGVIGAMGGAILGTGAIAAAFAAVVGVATHATAFAALLAPALTAANMTAIFGVGGATLGGYKALHRTSDTDTFLIRSIDEVETFKDAIPESQALLSGVLTDGDDGGMTCKQVADRSPELPLPISLDLSSVVEEDTRPAVVVPSHTRCVAMAHVARNTRISRRFRHIVFGVDSQLSGYDLHLKAVKLTSGVWAVTPPYFIGADFTGIFACTNLFARPTGAGFIVCYAAVPTAKAAGGKAAMRVWIRAGVDFLGVLQVSFYVERVTLNLDPFAAEYVLETLASSEDHTRTTQGITVEAHITPFTFVKIFSANDARQLVRPVVFPVRELTQRQSEYMRDVKQRRKLALAFANRSTHTVRLQEAKMANGVQWSDTPCPKLLRAYEASLTVFSNAAWSLEGAEGSVTAQVVNSREKPLVMRYFVKVAFEVTALNRVRLALATAPTEQEIRQTELQLDTLDADEFEVSLRPGLFFSLRVRLVPDEFAVQLHIGDAVERPFVVGASSAASMSPLCVSAASLAVGVCGFATVCDPRRCMQDQQVGLWQPVMRTTSLLGGATNSVERYAVQWEDELLMRFGDAIHVDVQVVDRVGKNAMGRVKKEATKQLLQGAIFSGFHAFKSLIGVFEFPLYAVWASDVIDNAFATISNRSEFAGKDLASALLDPSKGRRPVTLVGFSFGSKVIAECLLELYNVGAFGVVENAYLLGCTFAADGEQWRKMRSIVAGRLVNAHTRSDWMLWMMFKANEGDLKPMAGITAVNVPGVENVDISPIVLQHSDYARKLKDALDIIPLQPTKDSWNPGERTGSPGVLVSGLKMAETMTAVRSSLTSLLSSTPSCTFGLRNCVASAKAPVSFDVVNSTLYNCFYEYTPPESVEATQAAVFGALGDGISTEMGGFVALRMNLDQYTASHDVLVLLFFYCSLELDTVVSMVVPHLVERHGSHLQNTEEDVAAEIIAAHVAAGFDGVKRVCRNCSSLPEEEDGMKEETEHVDLAVLPDLFVDHHTRTCIALSHICRRNGLTLVARGLLVPSASQLQGELFTQKDYDTLYGVPAAAAAAAASNGMGDGAGGSSIAPTIAEVKPTSALQSTLKQLGAQWADEDATVQATLPSYVCDRLPVAVVNCSDVTLHLNERAFCADTAAASASQNGGDADPSENVEVVTWVRYPPPGIPPHSFAVLLLENFQSGGRCETIRYESVRAAWGAELISESTDDATAQPQQQQPHHRTLVCRCTPQSADAAGGTAVMSTAMFGATEFYIAMLTAPSGAGGQDDELESPHVRKGLKECGWYLT